MTFSTLLMTLTIQSKCGNASRIDLTMQ
jgi:hypothetical protein